MAATKPYRATTEPDVLTLETAPLVGAGAAVVVAPPVEDPGVLGPPGTALELGELTEVVKVEVEPGVEGIPEAVPVAEPVPLPESDPLPVPVVVGLEGLLVVVVVVMEPGSVVETEEEVVEWPAELVVEDLVEEVSGAEAPLILMLSAEPLLSL